MDDDGVAAVSVDTPDAVGRRLIRLGSRVHRLQIEHLAALSTPLSVRQYRILDRVDHGNTSLGQLAKLARRRPSTISKSADSLVRHGLLTRAEAAEDRRIIVLRLTTAGAELLGEAREAMRELARWLVSVSGMDTARLAVFIDDLYEQTESAMDNLEAPRPGRADPPEIDLRQHLEKPVGEIEQDRPVVVIGAVRQAFVELEVPGRGPDRALIELDGLGRRRHPVLSAVDGEERARQVLGSVAFSVVA